MTHTKITRFVVIITYTLVIISGETNGDMKENEGFDMETRPYLDRSFSGDVTALAGQSAALNCRVHNIQNNTVSWVRHHDIHLLTVGKYTYTSDQRFKAVHQKPDFWILNIKNVQRSDAGIYECQVSTTPPLSHHVTLKVVEPEINILGSPDLHVKKDSTINLTCIIRFLPNPPRSVYWMHKNKTIDYNSERGGITVILEKDDRITTSTLLIQNATSFDSGEYECEPSNFQEAKIFVHVLSDRSSTSSITDLNLE